MDGGGGEKVVEWEELVGGGDLCLDALRYLHRCAAILASMYQMPACPVFHAAHSPPARKPLPQVRKPNLHSDHGQDSNPCAWRPSDPKARMVPLYTTAVWFGFI
ncbi:hypothetical protein E2C01_088934 [Portunus trituberculatus]|uniref:Uncharacterized protein n=1 Tax=Portunus trituberculatus TaxID=210409 RepID=A0A5B7JHE2_PORTR|nr:hypothetical protein [Portunus trituberculatus]